MKLKTKLTALCAALLLAVAVSLTAAMLWQVREQSYEALLGSTEETLNDLVDDFGAAVYRSSTDGLDSLSRKALLTYCFRSCSVPGSALVVNGECLSASAQIDPERYLDVHYGGTQSARAYVDGKHFLILSKAADIREMDCSVYLVADATYIYSQLWQLSGRFALLALSIGLLGLGAVYWMISRTLRPLSRLSEAAGSIADGNYSQRVPVVSQDEVGTLAGNFNRMALAGGDPRGHPAGAERAAEALCRRGHPRAENAPDVAASEREYPAKRLSSGGKAGGAAHQYGRPAPLAGNHGQKAADAAFP